MAAALLRRRFALWQAPLRASVLLAAFVSEIPQTCTGGIKPDSHLKELIGISQNNLVVTHKLLENGPQALLGAWR